MWRLREGVGYLWLFNRQSPRERVAGYSSIPAEFWLWKNPDFPSRFIVSQSVLAVKGSLRRFAPWTACGPIRKTRCLRGERGGIGPWGARASG